MKKTVIAMTLSTLCAIVFTIIAYFEHSFAIEMTALYFIACTFILALAGARGKSSRP